MQPVQLNEIRVKHQRRAMHWAADAAALVLLFGAMMSAWALVVVGGVMLVGLLVYARVSRDPDRNRVVARALIAALVGGAVAGGAALFRLANQPAVWNIGG